MRSIFSGSVLALCACSAGTFELTSDGNPIHTYNPHASVHTDGSNRVLQVCGDFPTIFGSTDTGGNVCVTVTLDAAQLTATTLTLSGRGSMADDGTVTFEASASGSPVVRSLWFAEKCFCPQATGETFEGTLTLHVVAGKRLAGELSLTETSSWGDGTPGTNVVRASFDVSE